MPSYSCLVQERETPLPQQSNICYSIPSVWTSLGHVPTHGPIARSKMQWEDWLSMRCTGCWDGQNSITQGHFWLIASTQRSYFFLIIKGVLLGSIIYTHLTICGMFFLLNVLSSVPPLVQGYNLTSHQNRSQGMHKLEW